MRLVGTGNRLIGVIRSYFAKMLIKPLPSTAPKWMNCTRSFCKCKKLKTSRLRTLLKCSAQSVSPRMISRWSSPWASSAWLYRMQRRPDYHRCNAWTSANTLSTLPEWPSFNTMALRCTRSLWTRRCRTWWMTFSSRMIWWGRRSRNIKSRTRAQMTNTDFKLFKINLARTRG